MEKRRTDNSFQVDDFNIELENQSRGKMKVGTETDQRCDFNFDFFGSLTFNALFFFSKKKI